MLSTEPLVLQGLSFDLITYTPYSSLSGYFAVSTCHIPPGHNALYNSIHVIAGICQQRACFTLYDAVHTLLW